MMYSGICKDSKALYSMGGATDGCRFVSSHSKYTHASNKYDQIGNCNAIAAVFFVEEGV